VPRDFLTRSLPAEVRDRLDLSTDELADLGIAVQSTRAGGWVEATRTTSRLEVREADDGTLAVGGYAAVFDVAYDVAGGPPFGFSESFAPGAFSKALREADDIRFLINHEGVPLARTKSSTMTVEQDDIGLRVDVPSLDPANPKVQEFVSALRRGDLDQMSHAFIATRQEWNDDYTERRISEVRMFDVSGVTYPANDVTVLALRSDTPAAPAAGYPLSLALAQAAALGA
jgi:HK97 family phage prohead protease